MPGAVLGTTPSIHVLGTPQVTWKGARWTRKARSPAPGLTALWAWLRHELVVDTQDLLPKQPGVWHSAAWPFQNRRGLWGWAQGSCGQGSLPSCPHLPHREEGPHCSEQGGQRLGRCTGQTDSSSRTMAWCGACQVKATVCPHCACPAQPHHPGLHAGWSDARGQ